MNRRRRPRLEPCVYGNCRRDRLPGRRLCVIHQRAWDSTQMGRNGYQPLDIRRGGPRPPRRTP